MIKTKDEISIRTKLNEEGKEMVAFADLDQFPGKNEKIRMFARVELKPGEEVKYHIHTGECEQYYILSGKGEYSDNGKVIEVMPGTVTYTPSGEGHGIKNIGQDMLVFIALIVLD